MERKLSAHVRGHVHELRDVAAVCLWVTSEYFPGHQSSSSLQIKVSGAACVSLFCLFLYWMMSVTIMRKSHCKDEQTNKKHNKAVWSTFQGPS